MHLKRVTRVFFGLSGAAMLALLGWSALDGHFTPALLLGVAIGAGLLVAAFTGIDPTSDEVIPPASARFLELSDPKRAIDAEAMTSGPRPGEEKAAHTQTRRMLT